MLNRNFFDNNPTIRGKGSRTHFLYNLGKTNPLWKGNRVGYRALHSWVMRQLGKPIKCEFCGKEKTTPKSIHWASKSREYKRNLSDWLSLCVRCHKFYDLNKINV